MTAHLCEPAPEGGARQEDGEDEAAHEAEIISLKTHVQRGVLR